MDKFNILADWSFCNAVKTSPKHTQRYLSTLDKLTDPGADADSLNVAFQQLCSTETWLQIYAFPKALAVLKRDDFPFYAVQEAAMAYFNMLTDKVGDVYPINLKPLLYLAYDPEPDFDLILTALHGLAVELRHAASPANQEHTADPYHDIYIQLPFVALLACYQWLPVTFDDNEIQAKGAAFLAILTRAVNYEFGRMGFILAALLASKTSTGLSSEAVLEKVVSAADKGALEEADLVALYVRLLYTGRSHKNSAEAAIQEYKTLQHFKLLYKRHQLAKGQDRGLKALCLWQSALIDLAVSCDPISASGAIRDFYQMADNEPGRPAVITELIGEKAEDKTIKRLLQSLNDPWLTVVKATEEGSNGWLYYSPALSLCKNRQSSGRVVIENPADRQSSRSPRYHGSASLVNWIRLASALFNSIHLLRQLKDHELAAKIDFIAMISHISHALADHRIWINAWETDKVTLENYGSFQSNPVYFFLSPEMTGLLMTCHRQIKYMAAGYLPEIQPGLYYDALTFFRETAQAEELPGQPESLSDKSVFRRYFFINDIFSMVFDNYLGATAGSPQHTWINYLPDYCRYFELVCSKSRLISTKEKLTAAVLERYLLKTTQLFYGLDWERPGNRRWTQPYNYFLISPGDLGPLAWWKPEWTDDPNPEKGKTTLMIRALERFVAVKRAGADTGLPAEVAKAWTGQFRKVMVEVSESQDIYRITRLRLIEIIKDDGLWTADEDLRELIAWHLFEFAGPLDLAELFSVFFPHAEGALLAVSAPKQKVRELLLRAIFRAVAIHHEGTSALLRSLDYFKFKSRESRYRGLERILLLCASSNDAGPVTFLAETSRQFMEEKLSRMQYGQVELDVFYKNGTRKASKKAFSRDQLPAQLIRAARYDRNNRTMSAYLDQLHFRGPFFAEHPNKAGYENIKALAVYAGNLTRNGLSCDAYNCGQDELVLTDLQRSFPLEIGEIVKAGLRRSRSAWQIVKIEKLPATDYGQIRKLSLTIRKKKGDRSNSFLVWDAKNQIEITPEAIDLPLFWPDISLYFVPKAFEEDIFLRFNGQFYEPYYRHLTELLLEMPTHGRSLKLTFIKEFAANEKMGWLFSLSPGKNFLLYPSQFEAGADGVPGAQLLRVLSELEDAEMDPSGLLVSVTPVSKQDKVVLQFAEHQAKTDPVDMVWYDRLQLPFDKRNLYWKSQFDSAEIKNIPLVARKGATGDWFLESAGSIVPGFPPILLTGIDRQLDETEVTIDASEWTSGQLTASVRATLAETIALCSSGRLGEGPDLQKLQPFLYRYTSWKKEDLVSVEKMLSVNWSRGEAWCLTPENVGIRVEMESLSMAPIDAQDKRRWKSRRSYRITRLWDQLITAGANHDAVLGKADSKFLSEATEGKEYTGIIVEKPKKLDEDWCSVAWMVDELIEVEKVSIADLHKFRFNPGAIVRAVKKKNQITVRIFQRNIVARAVWQLKEMSAGHLADPYFLKSDATHFYLELPRDPGIIAKVPLTEMKSIVPVGFQDFDPVPGSSAYSGRVVLKRGQYVLAGAGAFNRNGVEKPSYKIEPWGDGTYDLERTFLFYRNALPSPARKTMVPQEADTMSIIEKALEANSPLKGYYHKQKQQVNIKSEDFLPAYGQAAWSLSFSVGEGCGPFCSSAFYPPVIESFYLFRKLGEIYADLINERGFLSPEALMSRYSAELKKPIPFYFVERRSVPGMGPESNAFLFEWGYGKHLLVPGNQLYFNGKKADESIDLFRGDMINPLSIGYEQVDGIRTVVVRILGLQINYTDNAKIYLQRKRDRLIHIVVVEGDGKGGLVIKSVMGLSERDNRSSYYFENIVARLELSDEERLVLQQKLKAKTDSPLVVYAKVNEQLFLDEKRLAFNVLPFDPERMALSLSNGERLPMVALRKDNKGNDTILTFGPFSGDEEPKFTMPRRAFSTRENLLDRLPGHTVIGKTYFVHISSARQRFVSLTAMPARNLSVLKDLLDSQRTVHGIVYYNNDAEKTLKLELKPGVNILLKQDGILFPGSDKCSEGDRLRIEKNRDDPDGRHEIVISFAAFGDRSFFDLHARPAVLLPKNLLDKRDRFQNQTIEALPQDTFFNAFTVGDFPNVMVSAARPLSYQQLLGLMSARHPKIAGVILRQNALLIDFTAAVYGRLSVDAIRHLLYYQSLNADGKKQEINWYSNSFFDGPAEALAQSLDERGWSYHDQFTFRWVPDGNRIGSIDHGAVRPHNSYQGPLFFDQDKRSLRYPSKALLKYGLPVDILINDLDLSTDKTATYSFAGKTAGGRYFLEISPGRVAEFSPGLLYHQSPGKVQLDDFSWETLSLGDRLTLRLENRDPMEAEDIRLLDWSPGPRNALFGGICYTQAAWHDDGRLEIGSGWYKLQIPMPSPAPGFSGLIQISANNEFFAVRSPSACFQKRVKPGDTVFVDDQLNVLGFPGARAFADLQNNAEAWKRDGLRDWLFADGRFDRQAFSALIHAAGGALPVTVSGVSGPGQPDRVYFSRKNQLPREPLKMGQKVLAGILGLAFEDRVLMRYGCYLFLLDFEQLVPSVPAKLVPEVVNALKLTEVWVRNSGGTILTGFQDEGSEETKTEILEPVSTDGRLAGAVCRSVNSGRIYWMPEAELAWVNIPVALFRYCYPIGTVQKAKLLEIKQGSRQTKIASLVKTAEAINEFKRLRIGSEINVKPLVRTGDRWIVMTTNSQMVLQAQAGFETLPAQFLATVNDRSEPEVPLFLSVFYGKRTFYLDLPAMNAPTLLKLTAHEQLRLSLADPSTEGIRLLAQGTDEKTGERKDGENEAELILSALLPSLSEGPAVQLELAGLTKVTLAAADFIKNALGSPVVNLVFATEAILLVLQNVKQLTKEDFAGTRYTAGSLQNLCKVFLKDICCRALRSAHASVILSKLLLDEDQGIDLIGRLASQENSYQRFAKFKKLILSGQFDEDQLLELISFCELMGYREFGGQRDLGLLCEAILAAAGEETNIAKLMEFSPAISELLKLYPVFYETGYQTKIEECHIEILKEVLRRSLSDPVLLMENLLS